MGHHDHNAVHFSERDQPVLQTGAKIGVIEQLPGLIEHNDGGPAIFNDTFDLAKDVGKHRHALGVHVQDLGHVKANNVPFDIEICALTGFLKDPAKPTPGCPFGHA